VIVTQIEQASLFSASELSATYTASRQPALPISREALQAWKQRIFEFQQQVTSCPSTQQGSLFSLEFSSELHSSSDSDCELTNESRITTAAIETDPIDPNCIDPFTLPQQNTEFWRSTFSDTGTSALYFVIDHELPILLYVGETVKANQRWKGEHDCKRYLLNYVTAHRVHNLPVTVNIGFWAEAPQQTRPRQRLESALIKKWRSPFNKENWKIWGTPFIGEKEK
jgi:hypothetical protein